MTRTRVLITGIATAALLAIAGVAVASIPASDGTIHGCYKNSTGDLRVIDSTATCPNGTTPLNWNQTGPQGPPGPAGLGGVHVVTAVPPAGVNQPTTVSCDSGEVALSGIAVFLGSDGLPEPDAVWAAAPVVVDGVPTGYVFNTEFPNGDKTVYVTCATVAATP